MRFAGTFEVFVPVPERVRAQRVALQFDSQAAAGKLDPQPGRRGQIAEISREAVK